MHVTMTSGLLFVCLGNSCRSIMAEGLARHLAGDQLPVGSAGLEPLGYVAPLTLEVLAEIGVPTHGLYSKDLREVNLKDFGLLVNLTTQPLGSRLPCSWRGQILTRPVTDPFGGDLKDYRRTREEIWRLLTEEILKSLF